MDTYAILAALLMGLTGSLHCAGMCGPIVLIIQFQTLQGWKRAAGMALYHFGRITVYAMMGLVFFSFSELFTPRLQQYISIVLGANLLLAGILSFLPVSRFRFNLPWTSFVKRSMGKFFATPGLFSLFMTGLLNGLLPCGLVYMALAASVMAANALNAVVLMYAFGLGTIPMLVALSVFKGKLRFIKSASVKKFVPVAMFVFGGLFVMRGLNLGIPMLSPKIQVEQTEIKTTCCHKN